MINGTTSRIIYLGAWLSILTCIVGIIVLAMSDHDTPNELMIALTGSFGIVGGAHLMPPLNPKATTKALNAGEGE